MSLKELRQSRMLAYLIDALESGKSIGHYGRLVLAIVGYYFLHERQIVSYLARDPECSEEQARALYEQIRIHAYSPPTRETVLEWQKHQQFPICPDPNDPDACNVYKDLKFPEDVYAHITDYYEQKAAL
jgi:hypothetical protein